jgi:hypothetical protein
MGFEEIYKGVEFRFHVTISAYGKKIKDIASRSLSKRPGMAMFSVFKTTSAWIYMQFFISDFGGSVGGSERTGKKGVQVYKCDDLKTFFDFVNDMLK